MARFKSLSRKALISQGGAVVGLRITLRSYVNVCGKNLKHTELCSDLVVIGNVTCTADYNYLRF